MKTDGNIGVISDTHGLLRPEAVEALREVDLIIHAGDVGGPEVLESLGEIAPVKAVRGNTDLADWAGSLPETEVVEFCSLRFFVLHDLGSLDLVPAASGFRAVISGHTHQPFFGEEKGVLFLNPGSAGPRRFDLPVSVARLEVRGNELRTRLVELDTKDTR